MADKPRVTFNGPVQAGAIGFGDGETVVGEYHETVGDDDWEWADSRPHRPDREAAATVIVADSVEFGGPGGPVIRGQQ